MNKPPPLKTGDRVGIFTPSSPVKDEFRQRGLAEIRKLGFQPVEAPDILSGEGYAAKPPVDILRDMEDMARDLSVRALWAARGGYGSNRLLGNGAAPRDLTRMVIIGSSDVSYLLWKIMEELDMPVFYGPMAYASVAEARYDREQFLSVVTGDYDEIRIPGKTLREGSVEAPVTGGCLSNLASLCGTRHFPETEGRIVLLEDTGERPYRLDRMLWQLDQNGFFDRIAGLLLGEFPGCFLSEKERASFYDEVLNYTFDGGYPVVADLPLGHAARIRTLPLGIPVILNTRRYPGVMLREKGVSA